MQETKEKIEEKKFNPNTFPNLLFESEEDYRIFKNVLRENRRRHLWYPGSRKGTVACETCGLILDCSAADAESVRCSPCPKRAKRENLNQGDIAARYPSLTAHVIAESLGYATPSVAAQIIADAASGKENWCEWVASCYGCDPKKVLRRTFGCRHHHKGFMAEYRKALALVIRYIALNDQPIFASWF